MIYDCFLFYNEVELLKLRLAEVGPYVDRFVIVEANRTFSGQPKEFTLDRYQDLDIIKDYKTKITWVRVEDMPAGGNPWPREIHQRQCVLRGIHKLRDDDIIIANDIDEIPRGALISSYKKEGLGSIETPIYRFYLNTKETGGPFYTNCIFPGELCKKYLMADLRRNLPVDYKIPHGGWAFSYLGSPEQLKEKILACSHFGDDVMQPLLKAIAEGQRPSYMEQVKVKIDHTFPRHIRENLQYYSNLGWIL